jgi:hypothetical protein
MNREKLISFGRFGRTYQTNMYIFLFCIFSLFINPYQVKAQPQQGKTLTASQVMAEFKTRHRVKSYISTELMLLVNRRGKKEKRILKSYYKNYGNGISKSLCLFLKPASARGVAVLTWDREKGDDDQWLYLPSQKKMRRVAQGSKKSYFFGTDITYEDMEEEHLDTYTYSMLSSEKIDNQDCYVIEAVPADRKKLRASGYSKRKIWIRKDIFYPVKIDFFSHGKRLIKTQTNHDLKKIEGNVWRPEKTQVANQKKRHKTLSGIKKHEFNIPLDDAIFSERFILTGKYLQ